MPACQEQRSPAAKGFQHWYLLLSQAAAPRRYCERKATNVTSLPAWPGEHRGLSHLCPCLFPDFWSMPSMGVVLLLLFTVQAPVQHLLSVMAANPPHSLLTEADQHIRLTSYPLMPLYFHFFPILVFSWRAGVGGALAPCRLSCTIPDIITTSLCKLLPVNDYPVSKLTNNSVPETSEKKKICTNGREGS